MKTPENEREVIGVGEVADLYGVLTTTVAKWDKDGKLKPDFRTPGGTRRYYRDRIEKLLRGQS